MALKNIKDWVNRRYPTQSAREAADAAIDELPESEPMTKYLDVWIATYRAAGGIVDPRVR